MGPLWCGAGVERYREILPCERSECFGSGTPPLIFGSLDFIARLNAPRRASTTALV